MDKQEGAVGFRELSGKIDERDEGDERDERRRIWRNVMVVPLKKTRVLLYVLPQKYIALRNLVGVLK